MKDDKQFIICQSTMQQMIIDQFNRKGIYTKRGYLDAKIQVMSNPFEYFNKSGMGER